MSETTTQPKPLHVLHFEAQNVLGVKAVRLDLPKAGVFRIGGENGAGKSSLVNSLINVFAGKSTDAMPIRAGQTEGHVKVELEDIIVTARWRTSKSGVVVRELTVANKDGARYQRPQDLLDALISRFSFDPFAFTTMKDKEQEEVFLKALPLDTSSLDADYAEAYAERTDVNRELLRLRAANERMPEYPDAPEEEVSIGDLTKRLQDDNEWNEKVKLDASKLERADDALAARGVRQLELDGDIASAKKALRAAELAATTYQDETREKQATRELFAKQIAGAGLIDSSATEASLNSAEDINRQVRANRDKQTARKEWQSWEDKRVACERKIQRAQIDKQTLASRAIAEANFAIPGLSLKGDHIVTLADGTEQQRKGGLYVGDVPFDQVNTAEQLKLSVALAVHENPRLRIYRVKNGEHLTPANVEVLHQLALGAECLILMETPLSREDVAGGFRKVEVFMEDGEAVEIPAATAKGKSHEEQVKEAVIANAIEDGEVVGLPHAKDDSELFGEKDN